jgi:Ca2+-binding EF-hand superfamily protein
MLYHVDFQVVFYWTLIARYVCRCFDADPNMSASAQMGSSPPVTAIRTQSEKSLASRIKLSKAQEAQIREIFELFDIDGGGTMDRRELDMAMVALGFKAQPARLVRGRKRSSAGSAEVEEAMMQDGSVDLEEFTALMKGELGGRDPMEAVRAVFAYLSRHDGDRQSDGLITLGKLQAACKELEVCGLPPSEPLALSNRYTPPLSEAYQDLGIGLVMPAIGHLPVIVPANSRILSTLTTHLISATLSFSLLADTPRARRDRHDDRRGPAVLPGRHP